MSINVRAVCVLITTMFKRSYDLHRAHNKQKVGRLGVFVTTGE